MMKYNWNDIQARIQRLLTQEGLDAYSSEQTARFLVMADLYGVNSHGCSVLPSHLSRLRNGGYNLHPEFKTLLSTPSVAVIDADNAIGFASAAYCMKTAIHEASVKGFYTVLSRNANAYGAAFCYPMMAAQEGMIGISCCNSPAQMAPMGGKEKKLGTNPISVVIPIPGAEPILIDMSTSKVAKSRFLQAKREGKPLGEGWALDPNGNPTTDPDLGIQGFVCPMEGFKGYALALAIDFIAGLLSGAACLDGVRRFYQDGKQEPMNVGHFFVAINPSLLLGEDYAVLAKSYVENLRETVPVEDQSVLLPGDDRAARYRVNAVEGLELSETVREILGLA